MQKSIEMILQEMLHQHTTITTGDLTTPIKSDLPLNNVINNVINIITSRKQSPCSVSCELFAQL